MSNLKPHKDPEINDFEQALLRSMDQAISGKHGKVHTPKEIVKRRGRPVGSVASVKKESVTLRMDADILAALRATGDGWQTRLNEQMRATFKFAGKL